MAVILLRHKAGVRPNAAASGWGAAENQKNAETNLMAWGLCSCFTWNI